MPHDSVLVNDAPIALARIEAGGIQYILHACPAREDAIHVKASPAGL